jgi:hypothetical protein
MRDTPEITKRKLERAREVEAAYLLKIRNAKTPSDRVYFVSKLAEVRHEIPSLENRLDTQSSSQETAIMENRIIQVFRGQQPAQDPTKLDIDELRKLTRDLTTITADSIGASSQSASVYGDPLVTQDNPFLERGALYLPNLTRKLVIPAVDDESTNAAEDLEEGSDATAATQTVDVVNYEQHEIGANTTASRKLIQQSEGIPVMIAGLQRKLQYVMIHDAFHGDGTGGAMTGLASNSRVSSTSAAGFSWDTANDAIATLAERGCDSRKLTWFCNPTDAATCRKRSRNTIGELGLIERGEMAGVVVRESNAITSGTMFLGDASQILICEWGTPSVLMNAYSRDIEGLVRITLRIYVDIKPRQPLAWLTLTSFS